MARRAATFAALAVLLALPGPAAAAVQDASEPPRTSGPLIGSASACENDGPSAVGGLQTQTCVWTYMAPAETKATEEYTAYWVQLEADTASGWCIFAIGFDTTGPDVGRIATAVPGSSKTGGETTVELAVDGEGAAAAPGSVAQDLVLPKGRVHTTLRPDMFTYDWRGRSSKKVVVALGLQLAYPVPPPLITEWVEQVDISYGTCRPAVARPGR